MRQRRDVECDSHLGGRYSKLTKCTPSRRSSRPPGTNVGVTVNRAWQRTSGTVIGVRKPGTIIRVTPFARTVCARLNRLGSPTSVTRTAPPSQLRLVYVTTRPDQVSFA